ncbi:hypothetical protein AAVH_40767 [Aphelenchoides avenae]|nr:hypothetical protein AAVH_40767 [Aphelenchus avenae]
MSDDYMSLHAATEQTYFEHFQKLAAITLSKTEFALGADEAKRFEAEVAKAVNSDGDVASRSKRLQRAHDGMIARMQANTTEERKVAYSMALQLQALTGVDVRHTGVTVDAQSIAVLSDDAKQQALELAMKLSAQYARLFALAIDNMDTFKHTLKFAEQDKTMYMKTLQKLAVTVDVFEATLWRAKDEVEQFEKDESETGERIAEAVRDMLKLAYKKGDPDRPTWSKIQEKPLECLESTVKAMKRASDGKGAGEGASNCADCQALKAKLDALQKENGKMLVDKKDLLEDRKRDKDEMERLNEKMAKLRVENVTEKQKKRNK